ncbi:MAG: RluA family pseudouridine synthase [Planctomycetaceae bacterium]|nr:RluA family pseudouridine synthase [Planctomycetaceae bacterium]
MHLPPLSVLYEDNHLLVVNKPSGIVTMGVADDVPSMLAVAKQYLKRKYDKQGNVYLGVVSRLDAPVSGVLLFARTSKAAARLNEQFRARDVDKTYWGIAEGRIAAAHESWIDWVAPDERHRRMHVVGQGMPGAQEARLSFRRLEFVPRGTWVEIQLETGRKHQIRLQFSRRGHPLLGDRKYGSTQSWPEGIALHARSLTFAHPVSGLGIEAVAPTPTAWKKLGIAQ